ncbi:MAG: hypothetical protein AAGN46_16505 [Acidobacteriota bacterium]
MTDARRSTESLDEALAHVVAERESARDTPSISELIAYHHGRLSSERRRIVADALSADLALADSYLELVAERRSQRRRSLLLLAATVALSLGLLTLATHNGVGDDSGLVNPKLAILEMRAPDEPPIILRSVEEPTLACAHCPHCERLEIVAGNDGLVVEAHTWGLTGDVDYRVLEIGPDRLLRDWRPARATGEVAPELDISSFNLRVLGPSHLEMLRAQAPSAHHLRIELRRRGSDVLGAIVDVCAVVR